MGLSMRKDFPELEQRQSPCKIPKKMSTFWTGSKPEHLLFLFLFSFALGGKSKNIFYVYVFSPLVCMLVGHICDLCQQLNL